MDVLLRAAQSHLKLCHQALSERDKRLKTTKTKLSRHYNTVAHTRTMLLLIEELQGIVMQDPDNWDEEPELVPF